MSPPKHWRYRCPRGHTGWRSRQGGRQSAGNYYCETCRKNGTTPHFDRLQDTKRGREVTNA